MGEKVKDEPGLDDCDHLAELEERFRCWRASRSKGERIPPPLWAAAVNMAREHGVPRVANKLRLSAVFLHKRMEGAAEHAQAEVAETEFVELLAAATAPAAEASTSHVHECVVELYNARGAKMRVELNAGGLAGLTHLCRAFWGTA